LSAGAVAFAFSGPVQAQNQPTQPPSAKATKDNAKEAKDNAKDAANQAKDAANKGGQAAKDNANAAQDKANQAKDSTKDSAQSAKNQLNKETDKARDNARDLKNDAQQSTQNSREYGRDTSRDARNQRDLNANDNRDQNRDSRSAQSQYRDSDNRDARYQDRNRDTQNRDARNDARDNRDRDSRDTARDSRTFRADNVRSADIGIWFDRGARDGLVISDLSTNGAIAKFGFHEGDRIVSINDHRVARESDFTNYLFADNVRNDRVKVVVLRDNQEEVVYVQPNVLVDEYSNVESDPLERYGIVLDDRYDDRIVVWKVIPRSPAYYAGIRAGDVLVTLRGQPLTTRNEFVRVATDLPEGSVPVQVRRGDRTRDYAVEVPAYTSGERRMAMRPSLDSDRTNERREARVEDRRDTRTDNRQDNQNNKTPATPLRPRR
jgi:C-terminal processing protease CtpA/Prc